MSEFAAIMVIILVYLAGIGICYFLVFLAGALIRIPAKILASFSLFGLLLGLWSLQVNNTDTVLIVNPPGYHISDRIYNGYLVPRWMKSGPTGFAEIPVLPVAPASLPPEETTDRQPTPAPPEPPERTETFEAVKVPVYDYPINNVDYLFLPTTLVFWALIGLGAQLAHRAAARVYNAKRNKNLPP